MVGGNSLLIGLHFLDGVEVTVVLNRAAHLSHAFIHVGWVKIEGEAVIDLLTPFSESSGSIPTVPAAFGGVGYQPFVTTWTPIPMDDADNSCGVLITFTVRTTVWQ